MAAQHKDDFYLGLSLNAHAIYSERLTRLKEDGYDNGSALEFVTFDNYLRTTGAGFSFQVGAIKNFGNMLRLGASYQSPTWYVIQDELSQAINSNLADAEIGFINFNQVNIFPEYRLRTPSRLTGSAALIFGKSGLLSFDYHYKDYNNMTMKPSLDFVATNALIDNALQGTSSYNIGGEYRIQKFSLRGGYRFEESPYKDKTVMDDLTGFSFGFGYNFGRTKFDMSYSQTKQEKDHQLYSFGLTNAANIDETNSAITASLTFSF